MLQASDRRKAKRENEEVKEELRIGGKALIKVKQYSRSSKITQSQEKHRDFSTCETPCLGMSRYNSVIELILHKSYYKSKTLQIS